MAKRNVVWIIGAGFSRPLGGPLLRDMLTVASKTRVAAAFRNERYFARLIDEDAEQVRALYRRFGPEGGRDAAGTGQHWEHAEEFIEFLDTAARAMAKDGFRSPAGMLFVTLLGGETAARKPHPDYPAKANALAAAARRLMAAECCAFLKNSDVDYEKWHPYRRWVRQLGGEMADAVITFNYDTVIESAAAVEGVLGRSIEVLLPGSRTPRDPSKVPLIKLHGSVDWRARPVDDRPDRVCDDTGDRIVRMPDQPDFALSAPDGEIVIASPGPTKKDTVSAQLAALWDLAEQTLREAEIVIFVGYRFPPTDATARGKLLGALAANSSPRQQVIHTVLGPDTHHQDSLRLSGVIGHAMRAAERRGADRPYDARKRTFLVVPQAMGAEDFLDLYVPAQLGHTN